MGQCLGVKRRRTLGTLERSKCGTSFVFVLRLLLLLLVSCAVLLPIFCFVFSLFMLDRDGKFHECTVSRGFLLEFTTNGTQRVGSLSQLGETLHTPASSATASYCHLRVPCGVFLCDTCAANGAENRSGLRRAKKIEGNPLRWVPIHGVRPKEAKVCVYKVPGGRARMGGCYAE